MAKVCPSCELTYGDDDYFCAADGAPLRSTGAEADNLVGTVIADRYRVEAIIGEGGMGRVYRARHVRVPREAAIKVLRRALIADPYAVAAFNREARNAASVGDHPNVAAVYDFGETSDGLVFLAMEFIEGETLGRRLERDRLVPPVRAVEIVRQIAAGLTAAHELAEPVVHRDLKPDNILLKATRDGSDWVKVVDFGIAKAVKRETQLLTTPGLVVGTPRYMSPEQLTGGVVDVRSDIYALGMIAFQMLTGRMPFASASPNDESSIQWALQRLTNRPLTLEQVSPDFAWPAAAQAALDHALAMDADDRTPSAMEFAAALLRAFGLATPSWSFAVVGDAPGPLSQAVATAASSMASTRPVEVPPVPAGAIPARVPPAADSRSPVTPPAGVASADLAPPRRKSWVGGGIAAGALVLAAAGVLAWQRRNPPDGAVMTVAPSTTAPNDSASPAATPSSRPRPTGKGVARAPAVDSSIKPSSGTTPNRRPDTTGQRAAPTSSEPSVVVERPSAALEENRRARADLDRVKSALADPDAVGAAGNGDAILQDIRRLLPRLVARQDSVEATYYAIETNLILDRPADACRLLLQVRSGSRGTEFEGRVERFLADTALGCANRR